MLGMYPLMGAPLDGLIDSVQGMALKLVLTVEPKFPVGMDGLPAVGGNLVNGVQEPEE